MPGVSHLEPAGVRSGVSQELRNRADRQGWVDLNDERHAEQPGDGGNVTAEVEIHTDEQRRIDHVHRAAYEQRVAIRGSFDHRARGDVAAFAGSVLYDECLTEPVGEPRANRACGNVHRTPVRKADEQPDRPRWVLLSPGRVVRKARPERPCGELEETATKDSHDVVPF